MPPRSRIGYRVSLHFRFLCNLLVVGWSMLNTRDNPVLIINGKYKSVGCTLLSLFESTGVVCCLYCGAVYESS